MAGLCRAAVAGMKGEAAGRQLVLDASIDETTGDVSGDAKRLREAVDHLLRNAITYAGSGGKVALVATGDDREVTVAVSDDGPGIPLDEQEDVFERFHKTSDSISRGETALGLGLPLTRQFVEAHGGSVSLRSAPGEGTTVTLVIPRGEG